MDNLSTNNIFYILVIIFIIFLVVENYLDSRHLIATILVIIILYFGHEYLSERNKKDKNLRQNFSIYFDEKKYPFIIKTKMVYDIYIQLSFLSKYNNISFNESALYMNKFLEIVHNFNNLLFKRYKGMSTDVISNSILYSNESLNLLKSIVTCLPINNGLLDDSNLKVFIEDPSAKILDKNLNILENIVRSLQKELITGINESNKLDINKDSRYLPDNNSPDINPIDSHGYMSNFSLY